VALALYGFRKAFLNQGNRSDGGVRCASCLVALCSSWDSTVARSLTVPPEPLPGKLKVLLCLVDGAERRRQIQAKLNVLHPSKNYNLRHRCDDTRAAVGNRMKRALPALWLIGAIVCTTNGASAQPGETASLPSEQVEVHSVVVDTPQVISLSYASPEAWDTLPSSVQLDEQRPATNLAAQISPDLDEIELLKVNSAANIRSGPSPLAEIIGIAHAGAEVRVASRDSGWVQIIDPWSWRTG
jgi:hypothetical protein